MPVAWFPRILWSLLPPFRPAPFLRRLSNRLPLPPRRHPTDSQLPLAAPAAPVQPPAPAQSAPRPSRPSAAHRTAPTAPQNAPKPTLAGRGTPLGVPRPASVRSPKTRPIRPSLPDSSLFTLSWGRGRCRCTQRQSVRDLPGNQPSDFAGCSATEKAGVRVAATPGAHAKPAAPRPVPPPPAPDLTARPSTLAPSSPPPHLKSFLEKTLTRAKPPHFAPPTAHPSSVPNTPHPTPMTGDNQPAAQLPGRTW